MADLIDLADYKALAGIDPTNNTDDVRIEALLPAASRAVLKYVDRSFEAAGVPSSRDFQYDGSGFLDIDDCTAITAVSTDAGYTGQTYTLDTTEWVALPHREESTDDPYYYMVLNSGRLPASREMGFLRNLDTLPQNSPTLPLVTVTATWGWPEVPDDVKLAVAWTIEEIIKNPEGPQSEAIEGWSRSWGAGGSSRLLGIPNRARDLLANYQRAYG